MVRDYRLAIGSIAIIWLMPALCESQTNEKASDDATAKIVTACSGSDSSSCNRQLTELATSSFPAPKPRADELREACVSSSSLAPNWAKLDPKLRSGKYNFMFIRQWLDLWASAHFGERYNGARCGPNGAKDERFSTRQWQRAMGDPETGVLAEADITHFLSSWDWLLEAKYTADIEGPKALSRMRQEAAEKDRQLALAGQQQREAALYANGSRVFGIQFGAPASDIPQCVIRTKISRSCTPSGRQCWDDPVEVRDAGRSCLDPRSSKYYFNDQDRPGWLDVRPIEVKLDGVRVVELSMVFPSENIPAAAAAMDKRFGPHTEGAHEHKLPGGFNCDPFGTCRSFPPRTVVETWYEWKKDELRAVMIVNPVNGDPMSRTIAIRSTVFNDAEQRRAEDAAASHQREQEQRTTTGREL